MYETPLTNIQDNNAYALLYHRVNNKVSSSPVDTQKFVQTKDKCEMEPPDNDSEASDSDRDAAFERLGKTMIDVASTITSDDDSEATEAPTDTPFQNPEKTTSNVDGECDASILRVQRVTDSSDVFIGLQISNMYKDAFEAITIYFAKLDLEVDQLGESINAHIDPILADSSGPPNPILKRIQGIIQDQRDRSISNMDDAMARLHEIMPTHLVKRWEELFDSVYEAATRKDTEAQAEVQAQESDDDLLPNTTEIEW